MKLPSADEYIEIINQKKEEFPTLHNFDFLSGENGKIFYKKSRHSIVFKAAYNTKDYAIRFFLNDDPDLFQRYQQIQGYLENKILSWKVPFEFLGEGYNPMLKMEWINSLSLTEYLDLIISDPLRISQLQSKLVSLHHNLEKNGIGHGNLNMKHIRLVKQEQEYDIKLIDYDSMFIPSFKEKDSFTSGTPGFQHPMRLASDFSETIDRFSFWVLLTALEAFKTDAFLWQNSKQSGFNKQEQIFFTYRDLGFPKQSNAFQLFKRYQSNALKFYAGKLLQFCNSSSLKNIEAPGLYEEKDFYSDKVEHLYAPKEINTSVVTEKDFRPADVVSPKSIPHQEYFFKTKDKDQKQENTLPHSELPKESEKKIVQKKVKKNKPVAAITIIVFLLVLAGAYFVWASQMKGNNSLITIANKSEIKKKQGIPVEQQTIFTSAAVSQFLFQLYHSYNKRELRPILSNYADSLSRYYDAGAITKNRLGEIIQDLFIKPAHYECSPDLKTLQLNIKGDNCKLTVTINETIKANARSGTERYSSRIEYIIDSSFKIRSEQNIE
jgi:predicted Ser/Thr protein kinase